MKFSHLHVHTQYSLLDGAASISGLYKKAIDDKMPALAISDHGNMFGVFEFVSHAYKHLDDNGNPKVKPIVGCEFYVAVDRYRKSFTKEEKDQRFHQILLAKNEVGYRNLVKLTSLGYMEGLYGKYPRIDKGLIEKYHEGLIATTCCLGAMVPQSIMRKNEADAEKEFKWWLDLFGEDYYVEFQRHGMAEQDRVNEVLIKFARKYGVKIIASNDSHYVDVEDFNAHDILLCINTGEKVSTPALREFSDDDVSTKDKRFAFPNDQFYFKKTSEMLDRFQDLPEAIDNTNEIVDKVQLLNLKRDILLPAFPIPKEFQLHDDSNLNQWEYLKHITYEGASGRYSEITEEIRERIDFELFTIKTMGFAGYFLIVSDYVVQKYGKNQVAQIVTYGTMAAKMSIKDVARVMDLPLSESNALAKLVPEKPGTKLYRVLHAPLTTKDGDASLEEKESYGSDDIENIKRLRDVYNSKSLQSDVLHIAEKLEGSVRNT